MVRSIGAVLLLLVTVLWFPLWVQLVCFTVAVILIPQRLALFIPAVFADALYAPTETFGVLNAKTTIFVALLLVAHWLITTRTRIATLYDVETK